MKFYLVLTIFALSIFSCKQSETNVSRDLAVTVKPTQEYKSFGAKIAAENAWSAEEMKLKYASLKAGDTISAKFMTNVNSVCKMKGCWMTLELPETDEDPIVKFKDYAFFVPKDIEGKEVIVAGLAFVEETSVEDQKHFAEDAGKSKEEINAIAHPAKTLSFLAHGVLLKE